MNRTTMGIALLTSVTLLAGCTSMGDVFVFSTGLVYAGAQRKLNDLTAERDELLPKYEKAVKAYERKIAKYKEATRMNLERGNLDKSYENLVTLYELTHPCGEEDCGTYPCDICSNSERSDLSLPALNGNEIMLEREGIDNESAFISESSDKLYELAGKYITDRRYDEVNVVLETYNPRVPLPSKNESRFLERQKNVKKTWLDVLVADAKKAESKHPAAAALFYLKAEQLAEQIKDPSQSDLASKASSLRARVIEERGYTLAIGSINGPASGQIQKGISGHDYPAEIRVVSSSPRVTLTISTSGPRYSRSKGSTTASFRYVSGQKDVISSRWKAQHEDCQSARGWLRHSQGFCTDGTSSGCDDIPGRQAKVDEECGALDGIQKMVKEDVYSDYSYPVKLLHLDTTFDFGFVLNHADGRKRMSIPRISDRLTDEVHDAHTAGSRGEGVSADPANPPSESNGYSSAKSVAVSKGRDAVLKSFETYRDKIAKKAGGGVSETDALATYIILRPAVVSDVIHQRVRGASGVTDCLELLRTLK